MVVTRYIVCTLIYSYAGGGAVGRRRSGESTAVHMQFRLMVAWQRPVFL
jgi:hypothetical protein